jgi:restriction system protein
MMLPTVEALQKLGGSGNTDEIFARVAEIMNLTDVVLAIPHGATSDSEVEYRLAWSRTYLKKYGVLKRTARGVWAISPNSGDVKKLDAREIVRAVREADKASGKKSAATSAKTKVSEAVPVSFSTEVVPNEISDAPEEVLFQAKRYQGSVSPSQIRDFRGAMQGRTDKGLFITTGTFTREAVKEATRDGAPPIDLIDGEQLIQRLKELRLGVKIEMVESVEIDIGWFQRL